MRKKFVCEFLNVSRPFQANWAWRGASSHGLSLKEKRKHFYSNIRQGV
jgi:hypothetical protein